jgi:hypothetical protein
MTDALPLEKLLAEVDAVVADLEAATPRLTLTANYGERTSSGSKTAPAPVNIDAVSAKHALHRWLMTAAIQLQKPLPRRTPQALASHLLTHMSLVTANGWVAAWTTQLQPIIRDATNAAQVDPRGQPKVFAGTCADCTTELYAAKGDTEARCRGCGATYEVLKWRAYAATAKNYYIGTPADLSRKLSAPQYGYEVTADQIRKWANRGKLDRANPEMDETGKLIPPAYRLGQLLDHIAERNNKKPIDGSAA